MIYQTLTILKNTVRLSLVLLASAAFVGCSPEQGSLTTDDGLVLGAVEGNLTVYKGIPYAAPPVGSLRWRPPQPVTKWESILQATTFGPVCPQNVKQTSPAWQAQTITQRTMSEDCLTLNIWAPIDHGSAPLPVMVYIHGGNYRAGAGSYPVYDGSALANEGVVLVTLNYRLGFLGRFAHPAMSRLQQSEPLANYGLMDQIAALEWVKRNIGGFGGDPDNVTIFGHSAGGVSVNALMISPSAQGLFNKAIAQGSAVGVDQTRFLSRPGLPGALEASMEDLGQNFARHFKIDGEDRDLVSALRALPVEDILLYQLRAPETLNPVVDGKVIPDSIAVLFSKGKQHNVPYIAGANSWEWNQIAVGPPQLHEFLAEAFLGGFSNEELSIYDGLSRVEASRRWFAEGMFLTSTRYLAKQMAQVSAPTYLYRYTYVQENLRGNIPGAPHGAEVAFLYDTVRNHPELQRPREVPLTNSDLAMGDLVRGYWVQFAKTGDPNGGERPFWPAYELESDLTMELGVKIGPRKGLNKDILDFHESNALARRAVLEVQKKQAPSGP